MPINKKRSTLLASTFLLAATSLAFAHGSGGGGAMGGGMAGGMSGVHGSFGGMSANHISAQGLANTNGPDAATRQFGLARAQSRMNAQGLAHSKASLHAHTNASANSPPSGN